MFNNFIRDFSDYDKVKILMNAADALVKEKKDYHTAIKILKKALKIIRNSKTAEFSSVDTKKAKLSSCYRLLTIYSLKIHDLQPSLKYGKLYDDPGYLGDIYFEMGRYKMCLSFYMQLRLPEQYFNGYKISGDEKISRIRIRRVVKSFYELTKGDGSKYSVEYCLEV